jgi:hypothetical protein
MPTSKLTQTPLMRVYQSTGITPPPKPLIPLDEVEEGNDVWLFSGNGLNVGSAAAIQPVGAPYDPSLTFALIVSPQPFFNTSGSGPGQPLGPWNGLKGWALVDTPSLGPTTLLVVISKRERK